MSFRANFISAAPSAIFLAGVMVFAGGCLSTPRNFSSPPSRIHIVDQGGAPMSGIEVNRSWYDSDLHTDGHETIKTSLDGTAQFSKIPAKVGVFTGALRKTVTNLGPCGSESGTWTTFYVRFHGQCDVSPKNRPSHDVVSFRTTVDSQSNTVADLSFPNKSKSIDYELEAKPHDQ